MYPPYKERQLLQQAGFLLSKERQRSREPLPPHNKGLQQLPEVRLLIPRPITDRDRQEPGLQVRVFRAEPLLPAHVFQRLHTVPEPLLQAHVFQHLHTVPEPLLLLHSDGAAITGEAVLLLRLLLPDPAELAVREGVVVNTF